MNLYAVQILLPRWGKRGLSVPGLATRRFTVLQSEIEDGNNCLKIGVREPAKNVLADFAR